LLVRVAEKLETTNSLRLTGAKASRGMRSQREVAIVLRNLRRNPGAVIGATILALLVMVAIAAPWLAPYDPNEVFPIQSNQAPSGDYWLGNDIYGRDILSRMIFGTRISLTIGLISVGIAACIGVPVGLLAGWYGGWADTTVMRVTDAMLAFPGLLLALSIIAVLGPGLNNAMIAVGISAIPTYVRLVRGSVLSTKSHVYVDAARVVGCPTGRITFRHILPNVFAPVLVLSSLGVATAILSSAGLSFLGLGAQPPVPEWGAMVNEGRDRMASAWWISTFPSLAIMTAVLAINLLGDGLRDALDPRLRQR
jgi:peptide/nickel transport system permease protein